MNPKPDLLKLISLKEAAGRMAVSERWLRDHWRENGGTKAFGAIKFFEDLVDARLQAERQKAEERQKAAQLVQVRYDPDDLPGRERYRPQRRRSRPAGSGVISNRHGVFDDPHGIFSDKIKK
jgi:AraC-like DNA-binding protein